MSTNPVILSRLKMDDNNQLIDEIDGVQWQNSNIPLSTEVYYPYSRYKFSLNFSNCADNDRNAYIKLLTDLNFSNQDYAINMWVKINRTSGNWRSIMGPYEGNYITIWQIDTHVPGPALSWGQSEFNQGPYRINDGQWHNLVMARAGTNIRLFVDGKQNTIGNIGTSTVKSQYLLIGNGWDNYPFNGWLSDFTISRVTINREFDLKELNRWFLKYPSVVYNNLKVEN